MSYSNTRQDMHGNGQFGFACRRITRGKSAGLFRVEYGLAERDGPACRSRIITGTVDEAQARRFCEESLIAFPEPPAPKPPRALSHTATLLLSRVVVGTWFLPYALLIRRPTFVCQQLHKRGILEQRWRGGIQPTSEQILNQSWDVKDFHEYRLTVAGVLALDSFDVSQGTQTGWAQRQQDPQHFFLNGTQLCGTQAAPQGEFFVELFQATATSQACGRCRELLVSVNA